MIIRFNKNSKALFSYTLDTYKGNKVVYIIDQAGDNPVVSVTNDIENVIKDICTFEEIIDPTAYIFLYRDGEGNWDAYDTYGKVFVILGETNSLDAIEVYLGKIANDKEEEKQNDLYERSQL